MPNSPVIEKHSTSSTATYTGAQSPQSPPMYPFSSSFFRIFDDRYETSPSSPLSPKSEPSSPIATQHPRDCIKSAPIPIPIPPQTKKVSPLCQTWFVGSPDSEKWFSHINGDDNNSNIFDNTHQYVRF